jgi:tRNA dimethylallyltransferase
MELARRLGGEILSADSMQVYRGLDIGTAKPSIERDLVPHHLLDLVGPGETFDTARWLAAARSVAADVWNRGRLPILCGGTGLYFQVWREGLDAVPPPDLELRRVLEAQPLEDLLMELARDAPEIWARLDRKNPRRVVRAVEILRLGGGSRVESSTSTRSPAEQDESHAPIFVLRRASEDLRRRMEFRVDAMFAQGLVEETRQLLERGLRENRTALQAIGYRQVVEHLEGARDLPSTVTLVKARTWQYGRRQMTWFRHRPGVVWVDLEEGELASRTAERILNHPEYGTGGN